MLRDRARTGPLVALTGAVSAGFLVLLVVLVGGLMTVYGAGPKARSGEETAVFLRSGAGVSEIGATLEDAGVIRSDAVFKIAVQFTGAARSLKAGEYRIPSGASLSDVIAMLRKGDVVRHFVTVPEGRSVAQVIDILNESEVLTGEVVPPPEGSLLPETYEVTRGETRQAVIDRMRKAHDDLLAELWPKRKPGLPIRTPEQAVILASIVEKETGLADERPRVAAVFVNRLKTGMRLESDPTVVYGVNGGRPLGRGLRVSELQRETPYNTYKVFGLPPTPIANPGKAAIEAVLNPPVTDEYFFVADGTGGHVFAKTYEDHLENVARWRRIEAEAAAAPAGGR